MSFNRLSYDQAIYDSDVKQSTGLLAYQLSDFSKKNCAVCHPDVGVSLPQGSTFTRDETHVKAENILTNRDWKTDKTQLLGGVDPLRGGVLTSFQEVRPCSTTLLRSKNTLMTDPKSRFRSLSTQHLIFSSLPVNPQDTIPITRNPGFISSRDVAIDNYRKLVGTGVAKNSPMS